MVAEAKEPPADALGVLDSYPLTRAAIRTTCVATRLAAGTAENALAVEARATVNCRVMPEDKVADVERTLRRGHPGSAKLRAALERHVPGHGQTKSRLERRASKNARWPATIS